jgi:hypothetical protein
MREHKCVSIHNINVLREHRLALLEPRPFLRWRTTQMVRYDPYFF